jgi:hypothetical protein
MEILFIPKNSSEDLMNYTIDEINSNFFIDIKADLKNIDSGFKLKEVNLGTGADWVLIMAILNSITTIFLLGEKVEKGIDGWVKIGKRIKSLFSKTDAIYLDKAAAQLLALQYLAEKHKLKSVSLEK